MDARIEKMVAASSPLLVSLLIASADGFATGLTGRPRSVATRRAVLSAKFVDPLPPAGFTWAGEEAATTATLEPPKAPEAPATETKAPAVAKEPKAAAAVKEAKAPAPAKEPKAPAPAKEPKNKVTQQGIFSPLVLGAKRVMGTQELNELRGAVIAKHSNVISAFVDTSESPFGQLVLRRMFEYADKDGNGARLASPSLSPAASARRGVGSSGLIGAPLVSSVLTWSHRCSLGARRDARQGRGEGRPPRPGLRLPQG